MNKLKKIISKLNKRIITLKTELSNYNKTNFTKDDNDAISENQSLIEKLNGDLLSQENTILTYEIKKRNSVIESQQRLNNELLEILNNFQKDQERKDKTLSTLDFADNKLKQIEKIMRPKNIYAPVTNDEIPLQKLPTIEEEIDISAAQSQILNELFKNEENHICIFSDKRGASLGSRLRNRSLQNVYNVCTPGSSFANIIKSLACAVNASPNNTFVIVVGEKNYMTRNKFMECLKTLDVLSMSSKIIVCTLPYVSKCSRSYNHHIYKLNCDLYNIASLRSNLHLIDMNKIFDMNNNNMPLKRSITQKLCDLILYNIEMLVMNNNNNTVTNIMCQCDIANTKEFPAAKNKIMEQCLPLQTDNFLGHILEDTAFV